MSRHDCSMPDGRLKEVYDYANRIATQINAREKTNSTNRSVVLEVRELSEEGDTQYFEIYCQSEKVGRKLYETIEKRYGLKSKIPCSVLLWKKVMLMPE